MATTSLTSIMLASADPERLHAWYAAVLPPRSDEQQDQYRILGYGSCYLFLDRREDVGPSTAEPGRVLLNFEVEDAHTTAALVEAQGDAWVAPIEDRDGSLFATAIDPDGNYVQLIQLSAEHRAAMADS
ncbi:hypothetical protein BH20ACT5_BH20ACT5_18930 [soil metagenome]